MHRAEVHPLMLMASAAVPVAGTTKALFTSRPYLVGQLYTTDTGSIYSDASGNDGTFYRHLLRELVKVNEFRSTLIEVHVKVAQKPMRGVHLARFQVSPPEAQSLQARYVGTRSGTYCRCPHDAMPKGANGFRRISIIVKNMLESR